MDLQKCHEQLVDSQFDPPSLRSISDFMFAQKTCSILGSPTVLAANGLICIGTHTWLTDVFDFKQTLKCVCETDSIAGNILSRVRFRNFNCLFADGRVGAVTLLALSHDHTHVASGYSSGHISVFGLNNPGAPLVSDVAHSIRVYKTKVFLLADVISRPYSFSNIY